MPPISARAHSGREPEQVDATFLDEREVKTRQAFRDDVLEEARVVKRAIGIDGDDWGTTGSLTQNY